RNAGDEDGIEKIIASLDATHRAAINAGQAIAQMVQDIDKDYDSARLANFEKQFGKVARYELELLEAIEARKEAGEEVTQQHYDEVDAAVKKYAAEIAWGEKLDEQQRARRKAEADAQRAADKRNDTVKSAFDRLKQNIAQSREALALDEKMNSAQR